MWDGVGRVTGVVRRSALESSRTNWQADGQVINLKSISGSPRVGVSHAPVYAGRALIKKNGALHGERE